MNNYNYQQPINANNQVGYGEAIAALVLGILSIIASFIIPRFGCSFGVYGIICAAISYDKGNTSGQRKAGLICSIIGIAISMLIIIAGIAAFGTLYAMWISSGELFNVNNFI